MAAPLEVAAPQEVAAPLEVAAPQEAAAPLEVAAPLEAAAPQEVAAPLEAAAPQEVAAPLEAAAGQEAAAAAKLSISDKVQIGAAYSICLLSAGWLAYSMAAALPGSFWGNLIIAIAFEFSPLVILSGKMKGFKKIVQYLGASIIFVIGLSIYFTHSARVLFNEAVTYEALSSEQKELSKQNLSEKTNAGKLVASAQKRFEDAERDYNKLLAERGGRSWQTINASAVKEKAFSDWMKLTSSKIERDDENTKVSGPPTISSDAEKAMQDVAIRIGLFLIILFSTPNLRRKN